MAHLEDVITRVDAALAENVIEHMNELLIELSDDAELSREDRYAQQQRLRIADIRQPAHRAYAGPGSGRCSKARAWHGAHLRRQGLRRSPCGFRHF